MKIPKKILFELAVPFELVAQPYAPMARRLKMTEQELLSRIRSYREAGLIRRVGTVLGHFKVGYKCNALVSWIVKEGDLEAAGKVFAGFPEVTHCYARQTYPDWPYSLYTMVHSKDKKTSRAVIKAMASKAGVKEYKVQFTVKEFKKIKSDIRSILA